MVKYEKLVSDWVRILEKVQRAGGRVDELIIEPPSLEIEIDNKEKSLGVKLPLSFRKVLMEFSKHVEFSWFLPTTINLPYEFREIFSGSIRWHLDYLGFPTDTANGSQLDGKLIFAYVANGDCLAFDLNANQEPPVVYWCHEGNDIHFLANTFSDYIEKLTELFGIGHEYWQLEPFVDDLGINLENGAFVRYKGWFENFSYFTKDKAEESLDALMKYCEYQGILDNELITMFEKYDKSSVFVEVQKKLLVIEDCQKGVFYSIIGEIVGKDASEWVYNLWEDNSNVDVVYRSYLTSRCIETEHGLNLVISFIEKQYDGSQLKYESTRHLVCFSNNKVIEWIKNYISKATKDDWYILYASSKPTWGNIEEWLLAGGKYRMVALNALEYMLNKEKNAHRCKYKITDYPTRHKVSSLLTIIRNEEILNNKKNVYDEIISSLDLILA